MKQLILLISSVLCLNILFAQQVHQIMPKPTDQRIYDIEFFDIARGIMVGANGTILLTDDGGDNWEAINTEITEGITEAELIDRGNCIIRTSHNLYKTSDYGQSWELLFEVPDTATFSNIDMVDRVYGFAVCKNRTSEATILVATDDGGRSWLVKEMKGFRYGKDKLGKFAFEDKERGMLLIQQKYQNYNDYDWAIARTYSSGGSVEFVFIVDEYEAISAIVSNGNGQFYTGGWEQLNKGEGEGYWYGTTCYEVKNFGDSIEYVHYPWTYDFPLKTSNIKIWNDSLICLTGTSFYQEEPIWSLYCVFSTDKGKNWEWAQYYCPLGFAKPNADAMNIRPDGKIFISQSGGGYYSNGFIQLFAVLSSDGLWRSMNSNFYGNILKLTFDNSNANIVSENAIVRSHGNITHWSPNIDNDWYQKIKLISFADNKNGVVHGWTYHNNHRYHLLYHTKDGGENWITSISDSPVHHWTSCMSYPEEGRLYFFKSEDDYPYYASLQFTDNLGETYTEIPLPEDEGSLRYMEFTPTAGYLFGGFADGRGGYYKCTDENYNWTFYDLGTEIISKAYIVNEDLMFVRHGNTLQAVDMVNDQLLDGRISETSNYRVQDVVQDDLGNYCFVATSDFDTYFYFGPDLNVLKSSGPYPPMRGLTVDPDGKHIWAFGNNGRLYYLGDGMPVGVDPISHPDAFPFKIYGNPISNNLEFSVNLDFQGETWLQVLDMNGKLVQENRIFLQGNAARFLVNTSRLPSGTYICSLIAGDKRFSEKIVKE